VFPTVTFYIMQSIPWYYNRLSEIWLSNW